MWKVVLGNRPLDFRHTVEKTSTQNQTTIIKLSLFRNRCFLRNSFSNYREQFWPTCRNVSLKTWNFFRSESEKNYEYTFPKKSLLWTPIMQFRQPCRNVSAKCLKFPLRFQDHYWNHHFFENFWFSPKVWKLSGPWLETIHRLIISPPFLSLMFL